MSLLRNRTTQLHFGHIKLYQTSAKLILELHVEGNSNKGRHKMGPDECEYWRVGRTAEYRQSDRCVDVPSKHICLEIDKRKRRHTSVAEMTPYYSPTVERLIAVTNQTTGILNY